MATLILGTVGRLFGGPLGGIVGTFLGGSVDRALFGGGGKPREIGRIGNLAVQSAAYGEPLPFITGRIRAAGNLIWTSGITESASRSGGGKRSGPATTSYSYSASFAVALAAREIAGLGRIWADGKLIRDAGGSFLSPMTMRLHSGREGQDADPLIAAAEAAAGTPAYRGIAYAVFEDLPLADYGNRIPNLTFEIIADASATLADSIAGLATADGRSLLSLEGSFPAAAGHFAGSSGSIADAIAPLLDLAGAVLVGGEAMAVRSDGGAFLTVPADDCDASAPGGGRTRERHKRQGGDGQVAAVEIGFYDTSRDYQPGLQRIRRDIGGSIEQTSIACAMTPLQAKGLAAAMLARRQAARLQASVRLPWRYLGIGAGDRLQISDDGTVWQVRQARFEAFVLTLEVERTAAGVPLPAFGDGGRALGFDDQAVGPTLLRVLDLPPLPGDVPAVPRLWIAASGASSAWRRAGITTSSDGGASYAAIGGVDVGAVQGTAATRLGAGSVDGWDRFAVLDVDLLSDAMWLESRPPESVLAGSNLALVGSELIQFTTIEALAPKRFRLSGLLRGRRGTEAGVGAHVVGERFVLLDQAPLMAFDAPVEAIGRTLRFRATGVGDIDAPAVEAVAAGASLLPLAPVRLRLAMVNGTVQATWIRRSRAGFGWSDFVDAPLAEAVEAYRVDVRLDGRLARSVTVSTNSFSYSAADRSADGGGTLVGISVAQLSDVMGPGTATASSLALA